MALARIGTESPFRAKPRSDLVGESFWIVDYFPNIVVNGNEKYLYKAKWNLEDDDSLAFKVWTGSQECWAVLDKIAELGKFQERSH